MHFSVYRYINTIGKECACLRVGWFEKIVLKQIPSRFPGSSAGKESACNAGVLGLILGSGRSPEGENSYPLQYSGLDNSTDREAWRATVHTVEESGTWLSDSPFHIHDHLSGRWPACVRCMEQGAQSQCSGTTWDGEGRGREVQEVGNTFA